jgi:hypothetical protein
MQSEQLIRAQQVVAVAHVLISAREMTVPEQGHFLFEGRGRRDHSVEPPPSNAFHLSPISDTSFLNKRASRVRIKSREFLPIWTTKMLRNVGRLCTSRFGFGCD